MTHPHAWTNRDMLVATSRREQLVSRSLRLGRLLAVMFSVALAGVPTSLSAADRTLCDVAFLHVVSPDAERVTGEQCRTVANQTLAAWRFDADQMRWSDAATLESPLTLQLLSVARMKTEHAGLLGFAYGRDSFVVSLAVLTDPFSNGTLAHEIAHIQAKRAMGRRSERHLVPRYFIEGHGNCLGRLYRDHLGIAKHDYDAGKARQILGMAAVEAQTILTDDTYGVGDTKRLDRMEALGIFFVEYLRTKKGLPDAPARMGRVFESVGHGETYAAAFRQQFGASIHQIVDEIVALFARTASSPAERLKGTRYEALR